MIRLFILICLCLVLGGGLYYFMLQGAGYLLIVWGKTSIEMSLWVAMVLIFVLIFCSWLGLYFYHSGINGLIAVKNALVGHSKHKANDLMIAGLTDFIEGNFFDARKKLERSAAKVKSPFINYLAAARSAYELGAEQQALQLLHKAEQSEDSSQLAISLTQARMQLANNEYEKALATLERACSINPEHPGVLELKLKTYLALQDWPGLKKILPLLQKHQITTAEERNQLKLKIHKSLLESERQSDNKNDPEYLVKLKKCWSQIPADIQMEQSILSLYASELIGIGEHDSAQKLLYKALNKSWQGPWIDLYGLLQTSNKSKALQDAEKWQEQHSNSSGLFLALGRLCNLNEQWGRAIGYFEKSLSLQERTETYAELARVQETIGQTEQSQMNFKKGLLFSSQVLSG